MVVVLGFSLVGCQQMLGHLTAQGDLTEIRGSLAAQRDLEEIQGPLAAQELEEIPDGTWRPGGDP